MGPQGRDRFDELLDGALKSYGDVEPRAGIEGRVLARVSSPLKRTIPRWSWALASVCMAALIIGVGFEAGHPKKIPAGAGADSATRQNFELAQPSPVPTIPSGFRSSNRTAVRTRVARRREPKLPEFPSTRVLNRQELAMSDYVERFPNDAVLIAQEQRSFEDEIRKTEKDAGLDRPAGDSER